MRDATFVSEERLAKQADSDERTCRMARAKMDEASEKLGAIDEQVRQLGPTHLGEANGVDPFDVLTSYIRAADVLSCMANAYLLRLEEYKRTTEKLAECRDAIERCEREMDSAVYDELPGDRRMEHVQHSLYQ